MMCCRQEMKKSSGDWQADELLERAATGLFPKILLHIHDQ